ELQAESPYSKATVANKARLDASSGKARRSLTVAKFSRLACPSMFSPTCARRASSPDFAETSRRVSGENFRDGTRSSARGEAPVAGLTPCDESARSALGANWVKGFAEEDPQAREFWFAGALAAALVRSGSSATPACMP